MKRVARADHVWRPLTAQRFTCAGDLRRAGGTLTGYREYARLVRLWNHPDRASQPPGMDAYSVVLEIKIDGRRIVGGVYELEAIGGGSPWEGKGFGFDDLDPAGLLAPSALESFDGDPVIRMTVSICVVRKSDRKCLHLATDLIVEQPDETYVYFRVGGSCSSFNNPDDHYDGEDNATHDFRMYGAVREEAGDDIRGFTDPHGELRLWDPQTDFLPAETILRRWHASKNWV